MNKILIFLNWLQKLSIKQGQIGLFEKEGLSSMQKKRNSTILSKSENRYNLLNVFFMAVC